MLLSHLRSNTIGKLQQSLRTPLDTALLLHGQLIGSKVMDAVIEAAIDNVRVQGHELITLFLFQQLHDMFTIILRQAI